MKESLVRKARIRAGLSLVSAAKKLGIPPGYLSEIEKGKRRVSAKRAEDIAKLYGMAMDDIFLPIRYSIREVEEKDDHARTTAS